ncbi:MAG: hypothetical protein R3C28_26645 [Pirellulaceae bacterium]
MTELELGSFRLGNAAEEIQPNEFQDLVDAASAATSAGDLSKAKASLWAAWDLVGQLPPAEQPDAWFVVQSQLGNIYLMSQDFPVAQQHLQQALTETRLLQSTADTIIAEARFHLGLCLYYQESFAAAAEHLQVALPVLLQSESPEHLLALDTLADAQFRSENYVGSLATIRRVQQELASKQPPPWEAIVNTQASIARLQYRLRQTAKAAETLSQAQKLADQYMMGTTVREYIQEVADEVKIRYPVHPTGFHEPWGTAPQIPNTTIVPAPGDPQPGTERQVLPTRRQRAEMVLQEWRMAEDELRDLEGSASQSRNSRQWQRDVESVRRKVDAKRSLYWQITRRADDVEQRFRNR